MSGAYLIAFVANFPAPQGSLASHLIIPYNNAPSVFPTWVQEYIFVCVSNSGVLQLQPFWEFSDWLPMLLSVPHEGGFPQHLLLLFYRILSHLAIMQYKKTAVSGKICMGLLVMGFCTCPPCHFTKMPEINNRILLLYALPTTESYLQLGWGWRK